MRKGNARSGWLVAAAMVTMAAVIPVKGQQPGSPGSFLTGVNPRQIKTAKVDVSGAMKIANVNRAFHQAPKPSFFDLSRIFPKTNLAGYPPIRSQATILDRKNNPFQPNPIVGKNLFDVKPKTTKTKPK